MPESRLARTVIGTLIKQSAAYPERLFVDSMAMFARCGLLLFLYAHVYEIKGDTIHGATFQVIAWSMLFYFCLMLLRVRNLADMINQDILSGNIEVLMARPINYLRFKVYQNFGESSYGTIIVSVFAIILLAACVGIPQNMLSFFWLGTTLITTFLGLAIGYLIYALVGLSSFYIEDSRPVYWIVDKAVMILGGSYLPIAFFPDVMKAIAIYSPFGASYFITHTVYDNWASNAWWMIFIQLGWLVVLLLAVTLVYKNAQKKLSVNGG